MHLKTRRLQAFTRATFNDNSIVICVKSTTETGRVTNRQRTQPRLGLKLSSRNFVISGHE